MLRNLRERLSVNNEGRLESVPKKIIRHVLTGDIDWRTIKSGATQLIEFLKYRTREKFNITFSSREENFAGQNGFERYLYSINSKEGESKNVISFLHIPQKLKLKVVTIPRDDVEKAEQSWITSSFLSDRIASREKAKAFFVGPTFMRSLLGEHLPNNGFFDREKGGLKVPFEDTDPIGQRRGALAIKNDGTVVFMDEKTKIEARDSEFDNFSIVSGTSFYFTNEDSVESSELFDQIDKSFVSYLIRFLDKDNNQIYCTLFIKAQISRSGYKKIIDHHAKNMGWKSYFALEMEYLGGGSKVLSDDGFYTSIIDKNTPEVGANKRSDHYLFVA